MPKTNCMNYGLDDRVSATRSHETCTKYINKFNIGNKQNSEATHTTMQRGIYFSLFIEKKSIYFI